MDDEKKLPSWAETPADYQLWLRVAERSSRLGFRAIAAGWSYEPALHGEVIINGGALRTSAPTVMEAVRMMDGALRAMEAVR